MKFDDYQKGALSTECAITPATRKRFIECALPLTAMMLHQDGLRYADDVKKHIFYGKGLSPEFLAECELAGMIYRADPLFSDSPTDKTIRLVHAWLGLVSEIPELAEAIFVNDMINLGEESGDMKYYMAILDDAAGYNSGEVAKANQEKLLTGLNARYRHGFSENAAINRNLQAEAAILASNLGK